MISVESSKPTCNAVVHPSLNTIFYFNSTLYLVRAKIKGKLQINMRKDLIIAPVSVRSQAKWQCTA